MTLTARRLQMHAAALLVGLWGVALVNYATPGVRTLNAHVKGEDWSHFWAVGRLAARHDARGIYDIERLKEEFERATGDDDAPTFVPVYGPQLALALAPFGVLPYGVSLIAWWAAGALAYWWCCRAAWRRFPVLGSERRLLLFAAAYPAFFQLVIHGQTTWIALACLTALWWSLRDGRVLQAGIALGLLAYKPQLGLAITVLLVFQGQWLVLATAAGTVLLQAAICALWFGPDVLRIYVSVLSRLPEISPLLEPKVFQLVSVRGFFLLLGVPESWTLAATLVVGLALLTAVVRGWHRRSFDVSFALLLVATLLIGGHTSVYDLVLLAPAFIVLAGTFAGVPGPPLLRPLLYAAFLLALSGPLAAVTRVQLATPLMLALATVVWKGSERIETTTRRAVSAGT